MNPYRNDRIASKEYFSQRLHNQRPRKYCEFDNDDGEVVGVLRCICAKNPHCEYPLPRMTDINILGGD
ncbi:MAG: hypothetical protein HY517_01615 [Candidatus Aenigmarchaeota archaeon]|nr:hypothetical protein [Candidatus Aenigmarchaeota archaeon]